MIKSRIIKVKSIRNEEKLLIITIMEVIITIEIMTIIIMIIKICNQMKKRKLK